jgi:hypothetical protein
MVTELAQLLSKYPEEIQELTYYAGELIQTNISGLLVQPDFSANIIGYGFSNKYADSICTVILSKKGIKIGFYKGGELPDPTTLLEGSGKVHKYVQVNNKNDIDNPALQKLLLAAYQAYIQRKM